MKTCGKEIWKKWPMSKFYILGKKKKFIKSNIHKLYFLPWIWLYCSYLVAIMSNIEICRYYSIICSFMDMPEFYIITLVSSLFEKLPLCTVNRKFLWKIKCSSRKSDKVMTSWLFLLSNKYSSIWKHSYNKSSIDKSYTFKDFYRSIIHFLVPLIYICTYSRKYFFCFWWNYISHRYEKYDFTNS